MYLLSALSCICRSAVLTESEPEELILCLADDVRNIVHFLLLDGSQWVQGQEPLLAKVGLHHRPPQADGIVAELLQKSEKIPIILDLLTGNGNFVRYVVNKFMNLRVLGSLAKLILMWNKYLM